MLNRILQIIAFVVSFGAICITAEEVIAKEAIRSDVKVHSKLVRISFHSNTPLKMNAGIKNKTVIIKFNKEVSGSFSTILANANEHIYNISLTKNSKSIVLKLNNPNYKIRKFVGDKSVGIDLIKIKASPEKIAENDKPKTVIITENLKAKDKIEAKKKSKKESLKKDTSKSSAKDKERKKKTKDKKEVSTKKLSNKKSEVKAPVAVAKDPPVVNDSNVVTVTVNTNGTKTWNFPWRRNVAAAIFSRANCLWVIFNGKEKFDLTKIKENYGNQITAMGQVDNQEYTILYFIGNGLANFQIDKKNDQWLITHQQNKVTPKTVIKQYESIHSKGIFFPADNMDKKVLALIDPRAGDQLMVVPFYEPSTGVIERRKFIDFELLSSNQGFAIVAITDNSKINIIPSGLEVIVPVNNISVNADKKSKKTIEKETVKNNEKDASAEHVYSILPFDKWHSLNDKDYLKTKAKFENAINNASQREKSKARLEYARFLLGIGLSKEASSILDYAVKVDVKLMLSNEVKMLAGVSNNLQRKCNNAKKYFDAIDINLVNDYDRSEILFWQNFNDMQCGKQAMELDYLSYKDRFLKTYPANLRYNLALIDLKNSIDKGQLERANSIIKSLDLDSKKNAAIANQINSVKYYAGLYALLSGDKEAALKKWRLLADEVDDRYNRARAVLAITKLQYDNKSISSMEAIEDLNKIRNTWRGDDVEFTLLKFLGELYYQEQNYIDTLRIWRQLVTNFPDSGDSLLIASKMSQLFIDMFGENGIATTMPEFKAIALFYEFRELTPIGKKGDEIIQQLAYKLVKLDLLERAEALLAHQVNYRLTGEDRIKVGNKLALVYLLDRKPLKAIEILKTTDNNEFMTDELRNSRRYLMAKALIESKHSDEAIELLQNDYSEEATNLKIELAWSEKDWSSLQEVLLPYFAQEKPNDQAYDKQESDNLFKLVLSYLLQGRQDKAKELYVKYKDKLSKEVNFKPILHFLTENEVPLNYQELNDSLAIGETEGFLAKYKEFLLAPPLTAKNDSKK